MRRVRRQIDDSQYPHLPLYFTEWSTSYTPRDLVHDSYISAPYILSKLKASQGMLQGMSYWVYSDLFEEPGPPPTPFHGGFGLMNREGIRKPAYFAYKYLHALQGNEIPVKDPQAWASTNGSDAAALIWDFEQPRQTVSNHPFYSRIVAAEEAAPVQLTFAHLHPGSYRIKVYRTGFHANDAYSAYIEMGSPNAITPAQIAHLNDLTRDLPETERTIAVGAGGSYRLNLPMRGNDIVLATVEPSPR